MKGLSTSRNVVFGLAKVGLMASIGARLRAIRQQLQLSLREVEKDSRRIARDRGDSSYQLSTSWLARLERYDLGFTVNKLLALAEIYKIPIDQLLRADYPQKGETPSPAQYPARTQPNCLPQAYGKPRQNIQVQPDQLMIRCPMRLPCNRRTLGRPAHSMRGDYRQTRLGPRPDDPGWIDSSDR
jgi:transcriptional regulator with XRE-family HTH domain